MIYGYARVSTVRQGVLGNSLEYQEKVLKEYGAKEIYVDTYSARKTAEIRENFLKLLEIVVAGDTIMCTKIDRFARTVAEGNRVIDELLQRGVRVNILNLGILDNRPNGQLIRTLLLAIAQFEADMIAERMAEGKAIARTREGYKEGRPYKYTKVQLEHAVTLLEDHTYKEVESMTQISESTLRRFIRDSNRIKGNK